jgi:ABC-type polysaccharide/polyol phosphate transport system ATPase subunit
LGIGGGKFKAKANNAMIDGINSVQTVVLVSHSMNQIKLLCNRVLLGQRQYKNDRYCRRCCN